MFHILTPVRVGMVDSPRINSESFHPGPYVCGLLNYFPGGSYKTFSNKISLELFFLSPFGRKVGEIDELACLDLLNLLSQQYNNNINLLNSCPPNLERIVKDSMT